MGTLYDVLGLSRQTTAAQIAQAYRAAVENLTGSEAPSEQDMIRAKAIKEAHAILSSPARRDAYDAQLRFKEQASYPAAEPAAIPWLRIGLIVLALIALMGYWKHHSKQLELERVALEAAKTKSAAEAAALQAEAEDARLAQARLADARRTEQDEQRRRDMQRAHDASQAHYEDIRSRYDQQVQSQAERQKEMAANRAKFEQAQEERAALIRNRQREMDMRRALDIPIVRH